jgi:hypothetical protein
MSIDHTILWKGPRGIESPRRKILARIAAARQYAQMQLADPAMRAAYEHGVKTWRGAYARAVTDFMNPPEICSVSLEQYTGYAGETITLHVEDDFKVAGVRLELFDIAGASIEGGEAREERQDLWRYKTKQTVSPFERLSLVITAYDIPGNMARQTIHLLIGPKPGISKLNIEP